MNRPATGPDRSSLLRAYLGTLALLALAAGTRVLPAGPWSLPLSLGLAGGKVLVVFACFMQLRWRENLLRLAAGVGFFWLALLFLLAAADYATRP
ncbi:MAG TPA: cytochrome C oxidase subunit IV family protein [Lacunisphaera sp.]|nr:cytochrome C oxidase subunit IV family protein [Lacunisphaera sp.]